MPSQWREEDAQDVEDFLLILDVHEKYAPKPEMPGGQS